MEMNLLVNQNYMIEELKKSNTKIVSFFCLFGFLTSSSATRLSRALNPRLTSDNLTCCHTEIEQGDHVWGSVD